LIRPFFSPDEVCQLGDRLSHVAVTVPAAHAAPARCYVSELASKMFDTDDHERRIIVMMMGITATITIGSTKRLLRE
jgi:hypothetical protein